MSTSDAATMLLISAICGVTFIIAACVSIWAFVGLSKTIFDPDPEPDRRPGYFAPDDDWDGPDEDADQGIDEDAQRRRAGYGYFRQRHGYGVNYNPTDMGTLTNARLYNFPNGPNGPNHPPR